MQCNPYPINALSRELHERLLAGIETDRIYALSAERSMHGRSAFQRNLAFSRITAK
jgi:hypothetical protein